ncbi:unnamed protein product [Owenia fusiformis]|uniref:alpha-L-fucosidase n=1 Tax=Owenia fusiformis TaxID=6347 RepID=A0A8J1TI25_OWEFU|nr:unnamed protein product [Owenia fusiformis]
MLLANRLTFKQTLMLFAGFQGIFIIVYVSSSNIDNNCPENSNNEHKRSIHGAFKMEQTIPDELKLSRSSKLDIQSYKGKYDATWASLDTRPIPEWYEDAKLGIFIHWGVYSVPSFVDVGTKGLAEWFWYNMKSGIEGETQSDATRSVQKFMKENYPPGTEYTDFAPKFTAEFYNATWWADVFKGSGAKYVVLTSKHHDGFTLWPSRKSWNWNALDNGPHRDVLGELARAVKKSGIHFGAYHSLYEWFNPLYRNDKGNNYKTDDYVQEKLLPELIDLVTKYEPEVLWTDGHWDTDSTYWKSKEFLAWLYNKSPVRATVVINDRWGTDADCKHGGFLTCMDRYNPGKLVSRKWENCMTIDRESWGYRRNAKYLDYYDMDGLTQILAETVSCGGNLLMNVGPTADGRISPIFEERLRQMGEWLSVNGEGIYATRPWLYQSEPEASVWYTRSKDGSTVYAIMLDWPDDDNLSLTHPKPSDKTKVTWLGYTGTLKWSKVSNGGLQIQLPKVSMNKIPCQWAWVFKMEHLENTV